MGVFDFIREAGAKVGLGDDEEEEATTAATSAAERAAEQKARMAEAREKKDAEREAASSVQGKQRRGP